LAGFGALAFLCKENGILIFAYAAVLNVTLLRGQLATYTPANRRLLLVGVASPLIALAIAALVGLHSIEAVYRVRDFTMGERLLTEPRILLDYLQRILLPRAGGLSVFHDDYPVSRGWLQPPATALAIAVIAAALASAWALRRRAPVFAFAVLWFFAGHLLESTVIALELYFEHRNYLPMVGPLFALAYTAATMRAPWQALARGLLAIWIVAFTGLTWMNAGIWGDRGLLANVWLAERPHSLRAIQMVASCQHDSGDDAAAARTLDAGIASLPEGEELVFQRALLDCFNGGIGPQRWSELESAADKTPFPGVIPEVVASLVQQSLGPRCEGTLDRQALRDLVARIMRNPAISHDPPSMSFLHYELSKLALQERRLDLLMFHLDESYRYRPSPWVPREQAIYLLSAGLPEQALQYLDRSDRTPQPWIKSLLRDMPARNASLRLETERMLEHARSQEVRSATLAAPAAPP